MHDHLSAESGFDRIHWAVIVYTGGAPEGKGLLQAGGDVLHLIQKGGLVSRAGGRP
jgi:hypothetical protein